MKFKWTLRMTILTPLTILISIVTAGGGHGTPLPTLLCYPILFLSKIFESGGGPLVWVILLGQFPIYGLVIDLGTWNRDSFSLTGLVVLFHAVVILITRVTLNFGNSGNSLSSATLCIKT